uniref:CCHC-type domain-containing protein n=1 Tax=Oryza brachyantha TaxID=4533 RepID=J3N952_ORYBR
MRLQLQLPPSHVAVAGTQEVQTGTTESVLTEDGPDVPLSDNIVLRKLLRIPRYFDPGETILETCFNCGEEGHVAVNCPIEKRKKPCFVCGLFGHNSKQCTQGQDCFICKKGGHIAKECPEKHNRKTQQSTFCLKCGESGHDMFGCANDYPQGDVKEIKCYVCNQKGHLCCADFSDICLKEVSCYNCAQPGHSGLGCAKQCREASTATTPTLCYKCGEEGHFARGCTKSTKSNHMKGESSAHSRKKGKGKNDFGARSAPYDARKTSKRKSPLFEERRNTPHFKSKARGGWIADDADDQPYKKYKPNAWASPSTPKKQYSNHQFSSGGDYSTPQSSRWQRNGFASPSSTYSPNARKHSFSSSRFASNTHVRFGRS